MASPQVPYFYGENCRRLYDDVLLECTKSRRLSTAREVAVVGLTLRPATVVTFTSWVVERQISLRPSWLEPTAPRVKERIDCSFAVFLIVLGDIPVIRVGQMIG